MKHKKLYHDFFGYKKKRLNEASKIKEAQLINKLTDYRGGVEYWLYDPAMANDVQNEINTFALEKRIIPLKKEIMDGGKKGYFKFRVGEDPALQSQQIQGFLSSKPEIKVFKFNVIGEDIPSDIEQSPTPDEEAIDLAVPSAETQQIASAAATPPTIGDIPIDVNALKNPRI
tara:strand:- start:1473 stop:1988 length:516 start_codon:yes stop_codon:yes gene_type:complete